MSASLVGSEMCIRDSPCPSASGRERDGGRPGRPNPAQVRGGRRRGGAPPGSGEPRRGERPPRTNRALGASPRLTGSARARRPEPEGPRGLQR
eukprot:7443625-Alexandrium_andersonii.AAC.1